MVFPHTVLCCNHIFLTVWTECLIQPASLFSYSWFCGDQMVFKITMLKNAENPFVLESLSSVDASRFTKLDSNRCHSAEFSTWRIKIWEQWLQEHHKFLWGNHHCMVLLPFCLLSLFFFFHLFYLLFTCFGSNKYVWLQRKMTHDDSHISMHLVLLVSFQSNCE